VAYKDLDTFFDPDLHLPIKGATYTVPAPTYDTAQQMRAAATDGASPVTQIADALDALGAAREQMIADRVPWPMILHAGRTAILHFGVSPDIAEVHWGMAHLGRLVDLEGVSEKFAAVQAAKAKFAEMTAAAHT
jgi:hypothetical protein